MSKKLPLKPYKRRKRIEPQAPKLPKIEMTPVRCACGKPRRRGITHTGVACYEEDE